MRFANRDGEEVWAGIPRPPVLSEEAVEAVRLALVCRWRACGVPWRWIGLLLREAHSSLRAKHDAMPPDARERYAGLDLGDWGM